MHLHRIVNRLISVLICALICSLIGAVGMPGGVGATEAGTGEQWEAAGSCQCTVDGNCNCGEIRKDLPVEVNPQTPSGTRAESARQPAPIPTQLEQEP